MEGDTLSIAWALGKCRYFILGCPNLVVATDHLLLLKILGDKCLNDIENSRVQKLKEKTLRYKYKIIHMTGEK